MKTKFKGNLKVGMKVYIYNNKHGNIVDVNDDNDNAHVRIENYALNWNVQRKDNQYWGSNCDSGYLLVDALTWKEKIENDRQ